MDVIDASGRAAGTPAARPGTRSLIWFVLLVAAAGAFAVASVWLHQPPWSGWQGQRVLLGVLAVTLILGELRPIPISRGDDSTDQITISTTSALMLLVSGPLGFALAVQCAAVLFDDIRARRSPLKIVFNFSQYVLTLVAARGVYALLSGDPFIGPYRPFDTHDLGAALIAGAAFFAVNLWLISAVVAIASNHPVRDILRDDFRFQATTSGVLIALAPVGLVAVQASPLLLGLLAMPLLAVHRSARLAVKHERESLRDPLTRLANRQLFRDRVERALTESERTGCLVAVMIIDLDHFKEINDTLGHQVGDELLVEAAGRLQRSLPDRATVARLGGDEFAVLLYDLESSEQAEEVAAQMLLGLTSAIHLGHIRLSIQASAGIALAPAHGTDVFTIMKRADVAMYDAKRDRSRVRIYRPEKDTHTPRRLELLSDLRSAVESHEMSLVFQPKLDLRSGAVTSVEALVRWAHPTRGLILPDEFITLAENTGMVGMITQFVLRSAVEQVESWSQAGLVLDVSVNVSVRDLADSALPGVVAGLLDRAGLSPARLTLEVTEHGVMADPLVANEVLQRLREVGVRVAVDDYGTGNTALTYLKVLSIDELKIDKSFITNFAVDENDEIIVRSTIDLAHSLGLQVVAEGVEDEATLRRLRVLGCDLAQGHYVSRPVTADELETWLRSRSKLTVQSGARSPLLTPLAYESA